MPAPPSTRYAFDGGLVLRDGGSGRIWLLEGDAALACDALDDAEAVAALAKLQPAEPDAMTLVGQPWVMPGRPPEFDRCLADGDAVLRVRVWDRRLAAVLDRLLAPLVVIADPSSTLDLFVLGQRTALASGGIVTQDGVGIGWWLLIRWLAQALRRDRRWLGVLHASTVVPPGADAVVIAGASGSGKTTLAGAMVAAGAALLSDDATPIEAGSRLAWPWPTAMGVKSGGWPIFAMLFEGFHAVEPVSFGKVSIRYFPAPRIVASRGHPVQALVFPTWHAGARLEATRLRPIQTLRLLVESGTIPADDADCLAELLDWLQGLPAWRLVYGDLAQALPFVHGLAADPTTRAA